MMSNSRIRVGIAILSAMLLAAGSAAAQEGHTVVDPQSESGLDYYAQGGVVLDGIAYFTSTDGSRRHGVHKSAEFPAVVAFDVDTFKTIRTYRFAETYDSSPLVIQKKDGTWLVIAHEHKKQRTVAVNRDTGKVEWVSGPNQPGSMFFGYSYFNRDDGIVVTKIAEGSKAEWPGPFGDPQTNQNAVAHEAGVKLVRMREIGREATE